MGSPSGTTRTVCLTFDYELFFGRAGTVERCMLRPTELIRAALRRHAMRATFFIDTTCLGRLSSHPTWEPTFQQVVTQLTNLVTEGHELGVHVHPHWIDATTDGTTWEFPTYRSYRLHSLPATQVRDLLSDGAQLLRSIVAQAAVVRPVESFRAGGLCIEPFRTIEIGFEAAGLLIDSSVAPGLHTISETHHVDHRAAPGLEPYRFKNSVLQLDRSGPYWEVPITTFRKPFLVKLQNQLRVRREGSLHAKFGDGVGLSPDRQRERSLFSLVNKLRPSVGYLSLEGYSPRSVLEAIARHRRDPFVLLSHPKAMGEAGLATLDSLATLAGARFLSVQDVVGG
jgi:peptidoglycan/xylan/chitin deacetylase (PgdA/CDA1 family)